MSANRDVTPVRIGQLVNIPEVRGRATLLLELSPSCPHCVANEQLYKRLKDLPQIRSGRVQIVIAMASPDPEPAQVFVDRDSIPGRLIVANGADNFTFPFYVTPTLLLLDQEGKIVKMWVGELHGDSETAFINALS
jgi:hypothetical protein